jgi:flagellum-specific peptidoglycan hydrolase FlgJ
LHERDNAAVPILQRYYLDGVGETVTAAQLQDEAWQKEHPWSSVFVSYVMRTAGAGSHFHYSRAHVGYIRAARRNRLDNRTDNPFWAYPATEVAPEVGDIICKARNNSGADYDNIADGTHRDTHGDIVTEIRPGFLTVVGGNVHQNVDAKRNIRILADGRLALDGDQSVYFAVVRCRGPIGAIPPVPVPPVPPIPVPPNPPRRKKLSPREFVRTYGALARISQAKYRIPALVTLAQGAIESAWDERVPRFNLFGIKAKKSDPEESRQFLTTREVDDSPNRKFPNIVSVTRRADGKYEYVLGAWFRAYQNFPAAFEDHARVLRLERYRKAFDHTDDPYAFGREIARARYNTDPVRYEDTIVKVIRMLEKASDGTLREVGEWEGPYSDEDEEEQWEEFESQGFGDAEEELDEFHEREEFEESEEETYELDPAIADIAERIMAREEPLFEGEVKKKKKATHCFTSDDIDRVRTAYEDNATAASNDSGARCSCIVMLNVALGALMQLATKQVSARAGSTRKVDMAQLTAQTIEKAMGQLQTKGYADPPIKLNFFNSKNGTAGTLAPVRLKRSLQATVLNHAKTKKCWFAFGLSIMDGYHSVLLLVDHTGDSPTIYWLDQFATGIDDDVTTTLDDRVTSKTVRWWQAVLSSENKRFNTTIRLWPLLRA